MKERTRRNRDEIIPDDLTAALPVAATGLIPDLITGFANFGSGSISSLAGISLNRVLNRRTHQAGDVLLEELKDGSAAITEVNQVDEAAAITLRYVRAAAEGTARLNLRLLAKVINGQLELGTLSSDEFLYYADLIGSLRREEIVLLATLHREWASPETKEAEDAAEGAGLESALANTREQLIPRVFPQ